VFVWVENADFQHLLRQRRTGWY